MVEDSSFDLQGLNVVCPPQAAAEQIDDTPFPANRLIPTTTPPIKVRALEMAALHTIPTRHLLLLAHGMSFKAVEKFFPNTRAGLRSTREEHQRQGQDLIVRGITW